MVLGLSERCFDFAFGNLPSGDIGKEPVVPFASFYGYVAGYGIARLEMTDGEQDRFGFACDEGFALIVAVLILNDEVLFLPGFT